MKENKTYHEGTGGLNLPESCCVNPFTVPSSYFETLTDNISFHIQMDKWKGETNGGFTTPEGYFEVSQNLLLTQSKLNALKGNSNFEVPKDYFSHLEGQIMSQVKLVSLPKEEVFDIPKGYFEHLQERVESRIFEERLKDLSPTTGFQIPEGYFDNLTQEISAKTTSATGSRPVRQLSIQRWIQYAAAACVAFVLGLGSYNAIVEQPDTIHVATASLTSIPEDEIINYLAFSSDSEDIIYYMEYLYQPGDSEGIGVQVEEEDIEDYLNYML